MEDTGWTFSSASASGERASAPPARTRRIATRPFLTATMYGMEEWVRRAAPDHWAPQHNALSAAVKLGVALAAGISYLYGLSLEGGLCTQ